MILYLLLAFIAIIAMTFGIAGRGHWSVSIAGVCGMIWLVMVVLVFWNNGWKIGGLTLLGTFIVGYLSEQVFRRVLRTDKRPSLWDIREENSKAQKDIDDLQALIEKKSNRPNASGNK
ncbi:MAG: hypothetical protein WCE90_05520 [Candidatus Zixiibacteriota bacterium]